MKQNRLFTCVNMQLGTVRRTQLPRIAWIVPDFHGDGVNLKKRRPRRFFKFVGLRDTSRHGSFILMRIRSLFGNAKRFEKIIFGFCVDEFSELVHAIKSLRSRHLVNLWSDTTLTCCNISRQFFTVCQRSAMTGPNRFVALAIVAYIFTMPKNRLQKPC